MRLVKIAIGSLAAVVVLLIAAAVLVAALFDPNDYKGVVTDAFTARTGRTLTIDEDLRLAYFPWLAVETGGIVIGSAGGDASTPFATVTRAAARVKLLPLLSRRVEIGTVELEGLTLNLARDAELRGNWQDLVDAASSDPAGVSSDPAATDPESVASLAIEGVRIREGNVYWRENTTELRYSVTGLELTTGGIGNGEPVEFDAALQLKNEISGLVTALNVTAVASVTADGSVAADEVEAAVTLSGNGDAARELRASASRVQFDRGTQTLGVTGLETETAGLRATWQLAGTTMIDNPTLQGSVTVAPAPLATLYEQLGWSTPAGVEANELGDFALSTSFSFAAEPRSIGLADFEAEVLGMRVRGAGTLDADNELAGRIDIAEFTPNVAVHSFLRLAVPPTVDVAALDRLALATRFDANLDTGRAALRELRASVFGATIEGTLEALPGERGNTFRGSVTTSRFSAEAFARAFAALLPPNLAANELGTIQIDTRFAFDTGTDTVNVAPFTAELFGLRASGEVTGRNVTRAAAWSGTATVAEFSPQDLLRRFGLPPQPTSDPQAFTRASVETRFDVTKERAALTDLALTLDDSRITGDFTLANFDAPVYGFTLAVDRVDADRYLPPKARDAQAGEATAGDIELPQNNTMNLDGTMQIGVLRLAGMQFQDVGSRIVIGGGDARLENARARLYGGEFNGNFRVRAAGSAPGLSLDGRASGLDLQPLIEALTGEAANFSGIGNFDLTLAGTGRTVIDNVQTAAGNVNFAMRDGAIKGFNLGRTLCAAYNATQGAGAPRGEQANQTSYEVIQGTATVTGGTAQSPDLLARTTFMDIAGAGTLGLVEQRLDYNLDAKLTGSIGIPGCETLDGFVGDSLPFNIRGTVTEPTITPDFSKLVQRRVREEIQERLQDRIQDRLRDILR